MFRWGLVLLAGVLVSCSSDDGGGGGASCPGIQPIQCKDNAGSVVGCCPLDHPVCSADGTQCLEGTGGGGTGGTASGGTGNTGNGGNGGTSATGGTTNGGTGGVGGSGALGGSGGSGGTGGTPVPCDDVGFEPNETESSATDLGAISDCDGSGSSLGAKLDTEADVDFYAYDGSDDSGCTVDPTVTTGDSVRVCMFADCSGVSAGCTAGTSSNLGGLPGCCVDGPGTVTVDVNCSGISDDATMYIRIDQGAAGVCTDYSFDYHY